MKCIDEKKVNDHSHVLLEHGIQAVYQILGISKEKFYK